MSLIKITIMTMITLAALAVADTAAAQVSCSGSTCTGNVEKINQLDLNLWTWNTTGDWTDMETNVCAPTSSTAILRSYNRRGFKLKPKAKTNLATIVGSEMYTAVSINAHGMSTDKNGGTKRSNLINGHKNRALEYNSKNIGYGSRYAGTSTLVTATSVRGLLGDNLIPIFSYGHFAQTCAKHKTNKNHFNCTYKRQGGHSTVGFEANNSGNVRLMDPWGAKIKSYGTGGKFLAKSGNTTYTHSLPMGLANTRFIVKNGTKFEFIEGLVYGGRKN